MFVDSKCRPVRINFEYKRRLKFEIQPRLEAAGSKGDIIEQNTWKSLTREVENLRVLYFDGGIDIVNFMCRIFCEVNGHLAELSNEFPLAQIADSRDSRHKVDHQIGVCSKEGLIDFEIIEDDLSRYQIHPINFDIRAN